MGLMKNKHLIYQKAASLIMTDLKKIFEQLQEGEHVYINHINCPAGEDVKARLWCIRTENGISSFCHHCGRKKYIPITVRRSIFGEQSIMNHRSPQKQTGKLPSDYTTEIPTEGLLWLFKYDITLEEIERYGIGYSASHNCVVLPVTRQLKMGSPYKDVIYWQGRRLGGLDGRGKKLGYYCPQNTRVINFASTDHWSDTLVLVEDYLSAIKVGRVCKTIALFGTKIPKDVWQTAIRAKKVYIWMDYDAISKSLYTRAYPIITNGDPKCFSTLEIERILSNNDY